MDKKTRPAKKPDVFFCHARLSAAGRGRRGLYANLYCAGNLTAAQATGANVDMLGRAVHDDLDTLNVGLPCTVGAPVGMTDLDTKGNALSANIAFCHLLHLLD